LSTYNATSSGNVTVIATIVIVEPGPSQGVILSTGAIVGIAIGGLVAVAAIFFGGVVAASKISRNHSSPVKMQGM